MPQNEEPGRTSRPSLLPEQAQQAPAGEDQSILSKLDGRASPSGSTHARRKQGRVAAGIAAVVVLGGGALAWAMQQDSAGNAVQVATAPAAPVQKAVPAPVPETSSGASADEPVQEAAPEQAPVAADSDVSAATILDEVPGAAVAGTAAGVAVAATALAARAPAGDNGKDELTALLEKPAATKEDTAKVTDKDDATKAADKNNAVKVVDKAAASRQAAAKKVAIARAERKARAKAAREKKTAIAATKKKTPAKTKPKVDTDAALLAALLAHSKASPAPRAAKPATDSKRCAPQTAAKCPPQPCESAAKPRNDCKGPAVAEISG
ncbi:hypothetical protein [Pseudoduganella albidiflava]|uniref:Transcriptional regulator n=1 Tax=Pseudoduganella albidiflava TaxID=321983 RepID=A0A411X1G2_9BURK|nr:hypothetical protein [Pseudoduganella albidiflava]QBI02705.1 hypothetical protein EYF70_19025 [Pseudoduganella albidiflava]GGY68557.1 hypothetical protein GCM10007387_58310 [Pseudoduganella albidiflava]